jgi:HK97 gp10 family phage protein
VAGKTTLVGGADLTAAWTRLLRKVSAPRTTERVLAGGAERIRSRAEELAPRGDVAPHIADNIVVADAQTQGDEQGAIAIGPRSQFAYGSALELGTVDTAAQPFMRPAFDAERDGATADAGDQLWNELESEVR